MVASVRDVIARGLAAYAGARRGEWVLQWPSQVVLAVTAVYWTQAGITWLSGGWGR
jgi:hypothetical protein